MAVAGGVNEGAGRISAPPASAYYVEDEMPTAWTGYIGFAAMMLVLIGCFHVASGLVGIFKDGYYVLPRKDLLVTVDYTTWGWTHLILGVLAIATSAGMMAGKLWARIVAVAFAVVSALVNLAFLNAQPVWSTLLIAFDVLLIWAVTVHGGEMRGADD